MSWVSVRAKIKAKLDTLVADPVSASQPLGSVMNGEQEPESVEVTAWPMAELIRVQTDPDWGTNREDMETYVFAVNIYSRIEKNNFASVETGMDATLDTLMQTFLDDASLTGTATARITPIQAAASLTSLQGKMVRRDTIFLRCRVLKSMS